MKHRVAFRKFSRMSSHRMLMLRNLVTSLFEHEQIKTTLPKARDTARLAEKIITMGKKGSVSARHQARAFLLKPEILSKVFSAFAQRYAERPGGYTRIHKFGHRPGDNAPHAILELVDNPRDLRLEMTARSIGWEILKERGMLEGGHGRGDVSRDGVVGAKELVEREKGLGFKEGGILRQLTRSNLQKVLRFRDGSGVAEISKKVQDYVDFLLAKPVALKQLHQTSDRPKVNR